MMSMKYMRTNKNSNIKPMYMPVRITPPKAKENVIDIPINKTVNKVKWGEPTWFLLHTLSVKIKDCEFIGIRKELLNTIYSICINLPCPDCANHAKSYLDSINFNTIQNKEQLKQMIHRFHNVVNEKKGYAYFSYENIDEKYSKAITVNIIRNFIAHFSHRNRSIKLVAGDLHRQNLCERLKIWFNENVHRFE